MSDAELLESVKAALGITGDYQDTTIQVFIDEVLAFLSGAGVTRDMVSAGIVARGVTDLWDYGSGNGKLSEYFMQRATQLSYKG